MQEIWKDVVGWEGKYKVSNFGRVESQNYRRIKGKRNVMAFSVNSHGYSSVNLTRNGEHHLKRVHRIVAEAFIPNPDNLPEVNHKDGDKSNNRVDNLEWTDRSRNQKHAVLNGLSNPSIAKIRSVPIVAIEILSGKETRFPSIAEASRVLGLNCSSIAKCIRGERKKTKTHYFRLDGEVK